MRPYRRLRLLVVALLLAAGAAAGHDFTIGPLTIGHPFARATPPGARTGGAYFTVDNAGKDADRLIGELAAQTANPPVAAQPVIGRAVTVKG